MATSASGTVGDSQRPLVSLGVLGDHVNGRCSYMNSQKAISREPLPDEGYFILGFANESCEYLIAMWLANAMGLDFPGRSRML